MIYGIGTDIVEVDRIAVKIEKGKGFRDLVFTANEIAYCEQQVHPAQHYAARFAAKEAFLKAMGTGWGHGKINFNEIEIVNNETGKPLLQLTGTAVASYSELQIKQIHVSLSHIKATAVAMVLIEV
ncbi:holo-ACP synthase [Chitinophaga pinensis]|uniref:Holo-[acyl-carrier-protein] synthase n=2 Tax=Chitinophaga pinensis TaxID=79329 RepID=A0A979G279_CHIPD|nr:holo-ACP synthase [Chitinophaga pinensis]ACU59372.1 holo-acyl-carrier-protein synthase [Chitinophaga pinensis DSM 2588]TWW00921.1 holo-ACP synthase [Chitinophaga pinensis]